MIAKYVIAALAIGFGAYLIVHNHTAPSTPILLTSGGAILLGGLLIDPGDVKNALASIGSAWQGRKGPDRS